MTKFFFILGAADPEMVAICRLLKEKGMPYALALANGRPVHPANAYKSTAISATIPADAKVVMVECDVQNIHAADRIDHHRPDDPGYGMQPEDYWKGSSIGQLCNLLGVKQTAELSIIAAADHCLAHAYAGRCPGVSPEALLDSRCRHRAKRQGRPLESLQADVLDAISHLEVAPRVILDGHAVADLRDRHIPELSEASAISGIGVLYGYHDFRSQRHKRGILTAPAAAIKAWMDTCNLLDVYGDPTRGYAGGFLE